MANHEKILAIETSRGLAAFMVVLYHCSRHLEKAFGQQPFHSAFQFGHAGVDFFFVLSGFIICFVHCKDIGQPARIGYFTERRFTRVVPFYWLVLGWVILVQALGSGHLWPSWSQVAASILLLPDADPIVGVSWTLRHEVLFYALFGVMIAHRHLGQVALGLWLVLVLAVMAGWLPSAGNTAWQLVSSPYNIQFFFGLGAAVIIRRGGLRRPLAVLAVGLAAAGLAGVAEDVGWMNGYQTPARFVYGLAAMMVVTGIARSEQIGHLRLSGPLLWLGEASYSLYLVHPIGVGLAWKGLASAALDTRLLFAVLVASGVVFGVIVSRGVERPLLRAVRKWLKRWAVAHTRLGP
ncbi:MAG: acyltransferase [Alphaproteobacteria bacterium]|nr:acyltransferase [Alphaproteobacteria bacterium]